MFSPSATVYICGTVIAGGFAYLLGRIPVQVSDSISNIATAYSMSWADLLANELQANAYLRPLIHPQTKLVLELAPGREFVAFRAIQVAQLFAAFWLFIRALGVRTWPSAIGALVALTVFAGSHTFATLIREGYPINNYLTVALCALVALNIATGERSRWWTDALVAAALVFAVGTIETGLLIWVVVAAAAIAGYRGVSRTGVVALTGMVILYLVARFLILDVGTPGLFERSSGFGLARLDPPQLVERFGDNPLPLYAYNVVSAASTVLLGEPRNGQFVLGRAVAEQTVRPWMLLEITSGAAMTVLIVWYAFASSWKRRVTEWTSGQRLLFVSAAVVAANAVMSYAYAKDQVMSMAGMFVAAACAAPIAVLLEKPPHRRFACAVAAMLLLLTASLWSVRAAGQQHLLVHTAFSTRNDWAAVDPRQAALRFGGSAELVAVIESLRTRALTQQAVYPHVWASRFVEDFFAH